MPPISTSPIQGLHHITATTRETGPDYHFYTHLLGLRLVKKTINFDDPNVYHLYYAPRDGQPGTVFTTFPYAGKDIRNGVPGTGQVAVSAFSVPVTALDFWNKRLTDRGVPTQLVERFGDPALRFADPSGLQLELIATDRDKRPPGLQQGIDAAFALRGLHHVHLLLPELEESCAFLEREMGFYQQEESEGQVRMVTGEGLPGQIVDLQAAPEVQRGKGGMGVVHHVAFRVRDLEELRRLRHRFANELGLKVTELKDRKYFQSIYFRFPGKVLFEIATSQPGFTVDEPESELGGGLQLPQAQEKHRARIESVLPKL